MSAVAAIHEAIRNAAGGFLDVDPSNVTVLPLTDPLSSRSIEDQSRRACQSFNLEFVPPTLSVPSIFSVGDLIAKAAQGGDLSAQASANRDPAADTGDFALPDDPPGANHRNNQAGVTYMYGVDLAKPEMRLAVQDISHEESRVYHYESAFSGDDDIEIEVDGPVHLSIAENGDHLITCADRVGMILPGDFKTIEVFAKPGRPAFPNHPAANSIGE